MLQIVMMLFAGYRIVYENSKVPDSFINGCQNPVDPAFSVLLTPLAIISFGIILNAHCGVFFEMVLTAFVSNIVMYVMGYYRCPEDMVPLVCSIAVTATARVYSYASGKKNYIVALLGNSGLFQSNPFRRLLIVHLFAYLLQGGCYFWFPAVLVSADRSTCGQGMQT